MMETVELFNLIVNGGGTAVLVYLVMSMRAEAQAERKFQQDLLMYLLRRDDPNFSSGEIRLTK